MGKLNTAFLAFSSFATVPIAVFLFQLISLNVDPKSSHEIYLVPVVTCVIGCVVAIFTFTEIKDNNGWKILPILGLLLNMVVLVWTFLWHRLTYGLS